MPAEKPYTGAQVMDPEPIVKLKLLRVVFSDDIHPHEVPAFRGAVADKVGHDHILFHNHQGQGFRYAYPLIQYKSLGGKAAIICLGEAVEEIHHYFEQADWSLRVGRRKLRMKIKQIEVREYPMQVWDKEFDYYIRHWVPLNQQAWQDYLQLEGIAERIALLETKLRGNILSFAKGIGWHVAKPIELKLTELSEPQVVKVKGVRLCSFHANFKVNVFLPNGIGLGGKVSRGFGVLRENKKNQQKTA